MNHHAVTKVFRFEAAHQLEPGCFTSECSDTIHGHSYRVELHLESRELDPNGMVIDFGELKAFTDGVRLRWDHALLLHRGKADAYRALAESGSLRKLCLLPFNPTAELLAKEVWRLLDAYLFTCPPSTTAEATKRIDRGLRVAEVRVWETETGCGSYRGPT